MGTPVNEFDPVTFVLGANKAIDLQLTTEQSWDVLRKVIAELKSVWKELPFEEGYRHWEPPMSPMGWYPEKLGRMHLLHVYGGQLFDRDEVWGHVTYFLTPDRKWLRIFTSSSRLGGYYGHEWLNEGTMMSVLAEDPSLLRYLIMGLGNQAWRAAEKLHKRVEVFERTKAKIDESLNRLAALNQPLPYDVPSSTPRLLT